MIKRDAKGHFLKGQSGNPNGAPKAPQRITNISRKVLDEPYLDENGNPTGETKLERALKVLADRAAEGDMKALEILANRAEGKPRESVDLNIGERDIIIEDLEDDSNFEAEETPTSESTDNLQEPEEV